MFEQSVVESRRKPQSKRSVITLPVSIALHAFALSAAVFAAVWDVNFPVDPPSQVEGFDEFTVPEPPASPKGNPQKPQQKPTTVAQKPDVPPEVIPDKPLEQIAQAIQNSGPSDPTSVGGVGDPNGREDGIIGGVSTEPAQPEPPRETYRVGGDVKEPVIIQRVEPAYPAPAAKIGLQGIAIVECTIDRYGNIQNVRTIHATHDLFRSAAESAVAKWKFKPGTLNGQPVDVIFNLTVRFTLNRR